MFKQRITYLLKNIGYGIGMILIVLAILIIPTYISLKFPSFEKTLDYILFGFIGIGLLTIILAVISKIIEFINWLFIKPFKHWKSKNEKGDKIEDEQING